MHTRLFNAAAVVGTVAGALGLPAAASASTGARSDGVTIQSNICRALGDVAGTYFRGSCRTDIPLTTVSYYVEGYCWSDNERKGYPVQSGPFTGGYNSFGPWALISCVPGYHLIDKRLLRK
jgi:hypothetical protein